MIRHTRRFSLARLLLSAVASATVTTALLLPAHVALAQDPPTDPATQPTEPAPDAPVPDAPAPDAPMPDAPEPDAPEPDAPEPDAPEPDAPEPDAPEPDAPDMPAPNGDAKPAAPAVNQTVAQTVEEFWHYGKVGRYDIATNAGQRLVGSGADPAEVLRAFEKTARDRKDNLDEWLIRWQNVPEMQEATAQVVKLLNEGRYTRRGDPNFIQQNIERLAVNQQGYENGIRSLRDSGELAVPFMIQSLRDPAKQQQQSTIRRALRDLGRYALNPLVAATESKDATLLAMVCTSLGDLGYDVAVPYLAKVAANRELPPPTRKAANDAMARIMGSSVDPRSAPNLFYQLAEKFYYDNAAIIADPRNPVGYMWYWSDDRGLIKTDVPPAIFNELMAMRGAEYALKLGGSQNDALSLWLASNYKREVELPPGSTDPTRAENQPDAHYYGVSAGAQYLNAALARTLKDRNAPVALKVIVSLQHIAGQSNALLGGRGPLIDAMAYPDRVIRFESAFAVAGSLPQQSFEGQNRVAPLLAEALAQTGQSSVLIATPSAQELNALIEGLKGAGFAVTGGDSADAAFNASDVLPSVDVMLISDELSNPDIERLLASRNQPAKLAGAAKIVMVRTGASPFEARTVNDPMITTSQARDAAGLQPAIEAARQRAGSLPVDPAVATQYATRAAQHLSQLAMSRGQILDLSVIQPNLLAALNDQRPEIVMLAGNVLGLLPSRDAQIGMLTVAADDNTGDDVKISLYKSLATSAKFFGNMLDGAQIETLSKVVADAANLEVRSAAAEAHGALNLPADQAKGLIVNQSRM